MTLHADMEPRFISAFSTVCSALLLNSIYAAYAKIPGYKMKRKTLIL